MYKCYIPVWGGASGKREIKIRIDVSKSYRIVSGDEHWGEKQLAWRQGVLMEGWWF